MTWRYRLIVPLDVLPQVLIYAYARGVTSGLSIRLGGADVQTGPDRFGVLLASAGSPTPTHVGGTTGAVDDATAAAMEADFAAGLLPPQVAWCRVHNEAAPARVARSSDPVTQAALDAGAVLVWDLPTALERVGMVLWRDPNLVLPGPS